MTVRVGVLFLLLVGANAHASTDCDEPDQSAQGLEKQVDLIDSGLAQGDLTFASQRLRSLLATMHCQPTPVDPKVLGRFALQVAVVAFYQQDDDSVVRYGQLAALTVPDLEPPSWLTPDHPLNVELARLAPPEPVLVPGVLVVPKGGGFFLNGALLLEPSAHAEVPGLVQVFDRDAARLASFWQDGAAFLPLTLSESGKPPRPPSWYGAAAENPPSSVPKPVKDSPGYRPNWALLGTGIGLGAAAAGLYAGATLQAAAMPHDQTGDELSGHQTAANLLVTGAVLTGAAATGIAVAGLVTNDGAMIGVRGRL